MMIYEWNPLVGIGRLKFNKPLLSCVREEELTPEDNEGSEISSYSFHHGDFGIITDGQLIESVACNSKCILNDVNLIGLNYKTFCETVASDASDNVDEIELCDELHEVYDFDDLGAQVWVKKGKVVGITVYDGED